jgi:hypothetical protein
LNKNLDNQAKTLAAVAFSDSNLLIIFLGIIFHYPYFKIQQQILSIIASGAIHFSL